MNIASQLKSLEIEFSDTSFVTFILNSLSKEYGPFKISYNMYKEKCSVNELLVMRVQGHKRLSHEKLESAHLVIYTKESGTKGKNVLKMKKEEKVLIK